MPTSSSSSAGAEDRQLVGRFLAERSEEAFRTLYRAHTPALYGFALRLTRGNEDAAQDVVQETWVRAVGKLAGFRWQSSLKTWLHAVALNLHREQLRRRATADAKQGELRRRFAVVHGGVGRTMDLEQGLRELPDGQREVMLLHDVEGYTHEEIGELLGIASGTSKSQLARARRAMRAWLDGKEGSTHAR